MGNLSSHKDASHSRSSSSDESSPRKYSQIFTRRKSLLSSSKTNGCANDIQSCESFNRLKQILTYYYKYIEEFNTCYQPRYSLVAQQSIPNGHEPMETVGVPATLLELTTNMSMPELEAPQMKAQIQQILAKDAAERKEQSGNNEGIYSYINNKFEKGTYSNIKLLNDFNHCLLSHCANDDLFEDMYNTLISLICKECDINSCLILRRNYRNRTNIFNDKRNEIYFGFANNNKEINIQQILDKIHCYYYHSYDLGFRLNTNLKLKEIGKNRGKKSPIGIYQFLEQDLNENEETDDEKIPNSSKEKNDSKENENNNEMEFENKNMKLLSLRDILLNKMKQNVSIRSHLRFKKENNRYFSDNNIGNDKNPRYYYWDYYKNKEENDKYNNGYKYYHWFIPKRFMTLKDELLNNELNVDHYNDLYEKALNYIETDEVKKKLLCNVSIWETSYEIKIGTLISLQQLMAIILYTSFDSLRRKFIKTFYYLNDSESKKSLTKRHCHYANLGRLLREICECFGVQTKNSKINTFFHGITYNVWIENVSVIIKYPFSTSLNSQTILNYILSVNNINNGLLLNLNGDISGYSTYFNCNYLSDFINENEILFIGGLWPLMYKNVISINNGYNLKIYLYSIHIINQMLSGIYYTLNKNINEKYLNEIQTIVCKLINHQLYKQYNDEEKDNNNSGSEEEDFVDEEEEIAKRQKMQKIARRPSSKAFKRSSFKPPTKSLPALPLHLQNNIIGEKDSSDDSNDENNNNEKKVNTKMKTKYKKFENIPFYIEKMMDRYCNKMSEIKLDYMRMNKEKSKSMPSYRGYKFCGDLFCLYKIEWFKLPIIMKLFPNLNCIQIYGNIELNNKIMDYILIILVNEINKIIKQYNISKINLKKANELLKLKSIEIDEPDEYTMTIRKAIKKYTNKFKKIQWKIYDEDGVLVITSNHENQNQNQNEND